MTPGGTSVDRRTILDTRQTQSPSRTAITATPDSQIASKQAPRLGAVMAASRGGTADTAIDHRALFERRCGPAVGA